jgi:hypothetical protein
VLSIIVPVLVGSVPILYEDANLQVTKWANKQITMLT